MHSLTVVALLGSLIIAAPPSEREIKGTELIVQAELDDLNAPEGEVAYQPNETLAQAFPGYMFVLARFNAVDPADIPEPLKTRNLYAVAPDGEAKLLATPEDVMDLFKTAAKPVKTPEDAKKAAQAALALEQAKYPEQPFSTPPESLQAKPDGKGGFEASGTSQPQAQEGMPSGKGPISVNLGFGPMGRPGKVVTNNNYQPPPRRTRPVTPADIAADQPAAQKAAGGPVTNINSPTVNKAFPGTTFYRSSNKSTKEQGNTKGNPIVAVGPDGKANVINDSMGLGRYVRQQYGKVTTKEQAREVMKAFLTLVTGKFPDYNFDPVEDSDIKVTSTANGGLEVVGTVYVKGNKQKYFQADWTFGRRGNFVKGNRDVVGLKKG